MEDTIQTPFNAATKCIDIPSPFCTKASPNPGHDESLRSASLQSHYELKQHYQTKGSVGVQENDVLHELSQLSWAMGRCFLGKCRLRLKLERRRVLSGGLLLCGPSAAGESSSGCESGTRTLGRVTGVGGRRRLSAAAGCCWLPLGALDAPSAMEGVCCVLCVVCIDDIESYSSSLLVRCPFELFRYRRDIMSGYDATPIYPSCTFHIPLYIAISGVYENIPLMYLSYTPIYRDIRGI